jgi:hypothetical protein
MNQELFDVASAHLRTIELVRDIAIANAAEVAGWIADTGRNERDVLDVCTVLNTWIGMKGADVVEIPETVVRDFMRKVQDRLR